jgi:hypothetical protein
MAIFHFKLTYLTCTFNYIADRTHLIDVDSSYTVADVKAAIEARQGGA